MANAAPRDSVLDFGPQTPTSPGDLWAVRRPRTPQVFSVTLTQDGTALLFTIGYNVITNAHYTANLFNVYFAPISSSNQAAIADPSTAGTAFQNAVLVNSISAPINGGNVTFTDTRFVTVDGWFWAVAVGSNGNQSDPTIPYRAPAAGTLINLSIPPNCSGQAVSKTSKVVNGSTYSLVKASAVVPSNASGVIAVTVNSPGAYTPGSPPSVTFTGGLGPGGVAATGYAVLNAVGQVQGIQIVTSGSGYVSVPSVVFGGVGGAVATATLGFSTAFDGFQLYLTNYFGGGQVEGPFVNVSGSVPGATITGQFLMVPDAGHTTTFTFVSVSRSGVRSLSGAPTATLIV